MLSLNKKTSLFCNEMMESVFLVLVGCKMKGRSSELWRMEFFPFPVWNRFYPTSQEINKNALMSRYCRVIAPEILFTSCYTIIISLQHRHTLSPLAPTTTRQQRRRQRLTEIFHSNRWKVGRKTLQPFSNIQLFFSLFFKPERKKIKRKIIAGRRSSVKFMLLLYRKEWC